MTQPPEAPQPEQVPPPQAHGAYPTPSYGTPWNAPAPSQHSMLPVVQPYKSGMYQAAAIINWVVLGLAIAGSCGIGIIAAAWFIPMTIRIHKGATDPYKHTSLGVCTLLFCNIISGILILVEDGKRPVAPMA